MSYRMILATILVFVTSMQIASANGDPVDSRDYMRHFVVDGQFDFIRDDLELAITARGIKINNVAHIGNMLARTAKDVGASKQVFEKAQAFEFCSSTVSRDTMEADPHNIVFCPYVIAVYSLPEEKDKVHIAFRRPLIVGSEASKQSLRAVEKLMTDIVKEVVGE